jgi:hypothetical protein
MELRVALDPAEQALGGIQLLVIDAAGGARGGGDARVHLARLAPSRQRKQDDPEREQRHDHDDREEQPQATAKAHPGRTPTHKATGRSRQSLHLQRRYHEPATGL